MTPNDPGPGGLRLTARPTPRRLVGTFIGSAILSNPGIVIQASPGMLCSPTGEALSEF